MADMSPPIPILENQSTSHCHQVIIPFISGYKFIIIVDITELNEEYMDGKVDQFTEPWHSRMYHSIILEPDGPDPLIISPP